MRLILSSNPCPNSGGCFEEDAADRGVGRWKEQRCWLLRTEGVFLLILCFQDPRFQCSLFYRRPFFLFKRQTTDTLEHLDWPLLLLLRVPPFRSYLRDRFVQTVYGVTAKRAERRSLHVYVQEARTWEL